jgi:hypothetical protein
MTENGNVTGADPEFAPFAFRDVFNTGKTDGLGWWNVHS